jgi:hypothetical protein
MTKKLVLLFLVVALSAAVAKNFPVTLYQPSTVAGTDLKAGDYTLDLQDQKIVLKGGKKPVESAVKVETAGEKYTSTSVRYSTVDGKLHMKEIRLGGTNMKLVLTDDVQLTQR